MAPHDFDPGRILGVLTEHGVDFVVIGGLAAIAPRIAASPPRTSTSPRTPAPRTWTRLSAALAALGREGPGRGRGRRVAVRPRRASPWPPARVWNLTHALRRPGHLLRADRHRRLPGPRAPTRSRRRPSESRSASPRSRTSIRSKQAADRAEGPAGAAGPARDPGQPRPRHEVEHVLVSRHAAPLRVIQWTTGNIGRRSLHAIIGRADMELVGVYAHGAEKVGRDAAELCGWPEPTGVLATDDIAGAAGDASRTRAATTRCGRASTTWCAARGGRQRLHQRRVDHRRQAERRRTARRIVEACEPGQSHDLRLGRAPGHDQPDRDGAQRLVRAGRPVVITESVDCSTYESAETQSRHGLRQGPGHRRAWPRACAARARCSPSRPR